MNVLVNAVAILSFCQLNVLSANWFVSKMSMKLLLVNKWKSNLKCNQFQ